MKIRHILLLLPLLCLLASTWAQPTHYQLSVDGGRVIPVNGSPYSKFTPTLGGSVDICWQTLDTNRYTLFWRFPSIGIHLGYSNIFHSIVGDRYECAGLLHGNVYKHLDWEYCVGFSFYDNPYCRSHNNENDFIGSYVNCLINLGFVYNIPFGKGGDMFIGAKLAHSSNGYLYKPNHGLNYLQASLGWRFYTAASRREVLPQGQTVARYCPDTAKFHPFVAFSVGPVMSRDDDPSEFDYRYFYYPAYTLQAGVIRRPHPWLSYGGELDLMYNFAHRKSAPEGQWPVYPALSAFADWNWGPLSLRLGLGHYLAYYPQNWEQYYERVGMYYHFGATSRHYAGVSMKVHYDHVDYIEWTYGIEF